MEKVVTGLPITKTRCERCGKIAMLSFGPVQFRVNFWFFNKGVTISFVYCPGCGFNKFKIETI